MTQVDPAAQKRRQSSHAVDRSRHRARTSRGYTSDQGVNLRTSHDKGAKPRTRANNPQSRRGAKPRMRAESEPRRQKQQHGCESDADDRARFKEGPAKKRSSNRKTSSGQRRRSAERGGGRQQQQQRGRAKSAPARCRAPEMRNSSSNNHHSNKLPREFVCPLSKRVMKDPVVDPDGNAYEREAIERWLRVQSSSPITNRFLSVEMLKPHKKLKSRIYKSVGKNTRKVNGCIFSAFFSSYRYICSNSR